ncbi:Uncharacterised protein [Staphylococcus microti]|uniref:Uncharacterized protein n=1 Tax=Staphylococcus microti TaxID=569857 RepID=A0A380GVS5_9STAP|nr:Uncharacterised protein [Staphylococcus microti]
MIKLVKSKINLIEKERIDMLKSHRTNYETVKQRSLKHRAYENKSNLQKHVEKELFRHF